MSKKNRSLVRAKVVWSATQPSAFAKTVFTLGMLLTASASVHAQVPPRPDAGAILEGTKEKKPVPKPAPKVLEVKPTPLVPEVVEAKPAPKAAPKPAPEVLEAKPAPKVEPKAPEVMEAKPAPKVEPKAPAVIEAKPAPKVEPKAPAVIEAKPAPKVAPKPALAVTQSRDEEVAALRKQIEEQAKVIADLLSQIAAKPAPRVASVPAPTPVAGVQSSATVKVSGFKIIGNTVYPEATLAAIISDSIGKELSFEDLNQVPAKVSAYYRSQGYFLAQAYLPAQDIKGGVVQIAVLEGRVGQVRLTGKDSRLRESVARGILSAIKPGELIEEENLERGLLLLNDFPGVTVKSTLQPGSKVGEADVVADITTGNLISGTVEIDNWGNRFASENRIGASLNLNNPTGFGDLFTIRALAPIKTGSAPGELNVGRISYLLPVGSLGTKLGVGYSLLDYRLGKDFAALGAKGDGEIISVFALHPFIRTRNFNLFTILGADTKNLEDQTATPISVDKKRVNVFKATLSSDVRDDLFGGGLNTLSLTYSSGKADLKTAAVRALDQSVIGRKTDGLFKKLNYEFQRLQHLQENLSLLVSLSGQLASKSLVSAEKFSLGGPTGVRAYPTGEGGGDEGEILSAELRWNVPQIEWIPGNVLVSSFFDQGDVQTNKNTLRTDVNNRRRLRGYGLGLNVGKPNDYLLRSSIAWHESGENPTSDVDREPRLFVQFTKWF